MEQRIQITDSGTIRVATLPPDSLVSLTVITPACNFHVRLSAEEFAALHAAMGDCLAHYQTEGGVS